MKLLFENWREYLDEESSSKSLKDYYDQFLQTHTYEIPNSYVFGARRFNSDIFDPKKSPSGSRRNLPNDPLKELIGKRIRITVDEGRHELHKTHKGIPLQGQSGTITNIYYYVNESMPHLVLEIKWDNREIGNMMGRLDRLSDLLLYDAIPHERRSYNFELVNSEAPDETPT
jgi:hypothetical protein